MLELKELYKTFNPGTINAKTALSGLSVTLHDGDFVTVIGGNGAGKSTMLNATAGTFFVDSGKVIIDGSDVTNLPEHKRAAFIGRVFQDPMMGTAPSMQIEENLALAARRGHQVAAPEAQPCFGIGFEESFYQIRAVQVARGLAGDEVVFHLFDFIGRLLPCLVLRKREIHWYVPSASAFVMSKSAPLKSKSAGA